MLRLFLLAAVAADCRSCWPAGKQQPAAKKQLGEPFSRG